MAKKRKRFSKREEKYSKQNRHAYSVAVIMSENGIGSSSSISSIDKGLKKRSLNRSGKLVRECRVQNPTEVAAVTFIGILVKSKNSIVLRPAMS